MDAIELVEKLSRTHGIGFSFDLPEDGALLGSFHPEDQSIHLTKNPSFNTVFHELGHYLHYKKVDPYFKIVAYSGVLFCLLSAFFSIFAPRTYAPSFMIMGCLTAILLSLFVTDKHRNGEKRANKYAYAEQLSQQPTVALPTVTGTPKGVMVSVNLNQEEAINVRSGPSTLFDIVGQLLPGQSVPANDGGNRRSERTQARRVPAGVRHLHR